MRTLAVIALKGGSGKTTIASHLALAAHRRGVDALVVDLDPQHSVRDVLAARAEPGPDCMTCTGAGLVKAKFTALASRRQLLIIDTQAGAVEDASEAIVLADLTLLIARPTLLDLAGLAPALRIVRHLKKPSMVVLNQAPPAREGAEPPLVTRALRALDYMQATLATPIVRSRTIYRTALERGRSAEEMWDAAAKREIAMLWRSVDAALAAAVGEGERL